jgi:hypothetical protein
MDRSDSGLLPLSLVIAEKPKAAVFRGWRRFALTAWVCASCGYTELYTADPSGLREAHARSQAGYDPFAAATGQKGAPASPIGKILLALSLVLLLGLGAFLLLLALYR